MIHFRAKDALKVWGWMKILHPNRNNKVGVMILISCKIDFKTMAIKTKKDTI